MGEPNLIDVIIEGRETWRSSGGGTSEEETHVLIERDAGTDLSQRQILDLVERSGVLEDGLGYVGTIKRAHLVTDKVKVYGTPDGRVVGQYAITVEKEW